VLLNAKENILKPNEIQKDTIVLLKAEGNKLVQYTTYISFRNLGLLKRENIIDNENWETKSKELKT